MEIEQSTSKFRKIPSAKIVSTGDVFSSSVATDLLYKTEDKADSILRKIISGLYQHLDSFSGCNSYSLLNFKGDLLYQPAWQILERLVSLGMVDAGGIFINEERYNDAPHFYRIDLFSAYPVAPTDGRDTRMSIGHGFGKNPAEVCSKAIGEFLERYVLLFYHKTKLVRGSFKSLKKKNVPTLDLSSLAGFSDEQKRWNAKLRFNDDSLFYWERTRRLSNGEEVYVPAQLIFWNYIQDELEPCLCEGNTNGAGGWFNKEGAILSGLYELIQRDAFLIYWLNSLTPKRIDPHSVPNEDFQKLLQESERYGFGVYCLDITSDLGIPTFAVIISDPSGKSPRFSLGGGCQADPAEGLRRALEEAWSVYHWMRPKPDYVLGKNYQPFRDRVGQDERLRLWANPFMAGQLEFFLAGKEISFSELKFDFPSKFASQKDELDFLVKKVESLGPGYEVYCYEPRHSCLKEVGYYSAQVIVPRLVPLYVNEFNAPLGAERLKEVPEKLGFAANSKFNSLPHLFP